MTSGDEDEEDRELSSIIEKQFDVSRLLRE
jgi:hypothetical protein